MITFKNKTAESLGVIFEALPTIPIGSPRHEYVNVPGRDGSLTIADESVDDVVITLTGHAIGSSRHELSSWLSGAGRLFFDEEPDRYLEAHVTEESLMEEKLKDGVVYKITVNLRCKPYFLLLSGQAPVAVSGKTITLQNPGNLPAYPKVKITGSGEITLKQSGKVIMTIKNVVEYVELDAEADLVHKGTASKESDSIGTVPVLGVGQTTLTCDGNVTAIEVIPNWRIR